MRMVLAATVAAAALAPPAQAHPAHHYVGDCGFFTLSDGTDSPQTQWDGEVDVVAIATDAVTGGPAAVPIRVECELRINNATPGTVVFTATGTGVAAGAAPFTFHADPDDVVTMCHNVTVAGAAHQECADSTTTPLVPDPVWELWDEVFGPREPDPDWPCDHIAALAGGPLDQPPVLDIRTDGDIYIDGEWFWDCPPYGTSGN